MGFSNYLPSSRLIQPGVCTSSTRPASPFEGQCIFETDTDRLLVWNGSAWVIPNAPAQNPTGLEFITSGALSGNSINFSNCFTSTYNNYQIVIDEIGLSGSGDIFIRYLKASDGTADTSSVYWWAMRGITSGGASADSISGAGVAYGYTGHVTDAATLRLGSVVMQITDPFLARRTYAHIQAASSLAVYKQSRSGMTAHNLDQSNSGIQFFTNSAVTMTGTVSIYGYRRVA